jgi:hypothetical protein
MYQAIQAGNDPNQHRAIRAKWIENEISQLEELLDKSSSQMEIASIFPKRRWVNIRRKIVALRGAHFQPLSMQRVKNDETYEMFLNRIQEESGCLNSECMSSNDRSPMGRAI